MIRFNRDFIGGTIVGFGAGVAFRSFSGEKPAFRNALKGAIKGVIATVQKLKESVGYLKENIEDLAAEVKSEMKAEDVSPVETPAAAAKVNGTPKVKSNGATSVQ